MLHELWIDLGARRMIRSEIEATVARYLRLNHLALFLAGGDRMQPPGSAAAYLENALGHLREVKWRVIADRSALYAINAVGAGIEDAIEALGGMPTL